MSTEFPYNDAGILWGFMQLNEPIRSADALLVLGSIDERVALHAARVCANYAYSYVVFTGGVVQRNSRQMEWGGQSEAEHFARIFRQHCKFAGPIILETAAQNTGDNVVRSYECIQRHKLSVPKTAMLVTKPYMERRAIATFRAQWPDKTTEFFVTSGPRSLEEYVTNEYPLHETMRVVLKDFSTFETYDKKGWQEPPCPQPPIATIGVFCLTDCLSRLLYILCLLLVL